jgi:hypothetical protein
VKFERQIVSNTEIPNVISQDAFLFALCRQHLLRSSRLTTRQAASFRFRA